MAKRGRTKLSRRQHERRGERIQLRRKALKGKHTTLVSAALENDRRQKWLAARAAQ